MTCESDRSSAESAGLNSASSGPASDIPSGKSSNAQSSEIASPSIGQIPSGLMTCERLAEEPCRQLTLFAAASPARMSHPLAKELAFQVLEAACGASLRASSTSSSLSGSWSRTWRAALRNGLMRFDTTWASEAMEVFRSRLAHRISALGTGALVSFLLPTATTSSTGHRGSRHNGTYRNLREELNLLPTLTATAYGSNIGGSAGRKGRKRVSLRSLLPTLTVKGNHNRAGLSERSGDGLATALGSGPLSPTWLEWYLGFPDGWTESVRSETASSRNVQK